MNQFRFAQLHWLHAIWIVLGFGVALVVLELRGQSILDRMLSPVMQARLVRRTSFTRRITAILLTTLSLGALVVAMMRPQWGVTVERISRIDSQIMVCLDVSKSMLAEDVAPNRLDRAKAELDSLLSLLEEGQQVGLIAFAGKATVLCPMTTDFGFLRLVLGDARPSTVGLGGTKIGEALRKAVDGFGEAGDLNRLILLITDGEDHDSFPLDAAKAAKLRGIRIVSIGFGDEMGSKIEITDARTGVRSFVKDANGQDVISRLDGEMLREIALETEGAYIPAGTGALDLESIYQAHIVSMLHGTTVNEQRVLRNEAYQWCVVISLVLLVLGLLTASPWSLRSQTLTAAQSSAARGLSRAGIWAVLFALLMHDGTCAQVRSPTNAAGPSATAAGTEDQDPAPPAPASIEDDSTDDEEVAPRVAYNDALAYVGSDPDRAERLLNRARRDAGIDGEVRFRALYNLGWVEVNRADALLEEQPREALVHLEQSAHRFREAIRVRPDSTAARHNLEVISRRILQLADALAGQDTRDIETRLDELIQQQRRAQAELAFLVQRVAREDGAEDEARRVDFRRQGISQRKVIADMQKFAAEARRELDSLKQKQEDEQSAEERLRSVQLSNMLYFVEQSLQRMQKARGLTRRMQGSRGFTRWSSALGAAKRARDQLRNPVEVLGVLIEDAVQLAESTRAMAQEKSILVEEQPKGAVPAWLTAEYLLESQGSTIERTAELSAMLASTVTRDEAAELSTSANADDRPTKQLLKNIEQAIPLLQQATARFTDAGDELAADRFGAGFERQTEAISALRDAAELFFDVRRLIEQIYGQQHLIRGAVQGTSERPEQWPLIREAITKELATNLDRCERLDVMFDAELAQIADAAAQAAQGPPAPGATPNPDIQRFELAKQILVGVVGDMNELSATFQQLSSRPQEVTPTVPDNVEDSEPEADVSPGEDTRPHQDVAEVDSARDDTTQPQDPLWAAALTQAGASLQNIEELRRLFFSLVEHLRDTAQRQANLNDDTSEVAGTPEAQTPEKLGPLAGRQQQLHHVSDQISQALQQQAEQVTEGAQQQPSAAAAGHPNPEQAAGQLRQASQLVGEAAAVMDLAGNELGTGAEEKEADFRSIGEHQQTALQKLAEALALLDDQQDQNQEQNQDQQQDQQQQETDEQQQQQQQQQQQYLDTNQLLQLIRDREAQRRKDRQQVQAAASGTVDKDW